MRRCVKLIKGLKAQFWSPGGEYFPLKLIAMEAVELVVQLNALSNGAVDSDAQAVMLSAIVLSCNFIVLSKYSSSDSYGTQSTHTFSRLALIIMIEVVFDKLLVLVVVLYRFNTITATLSTTYDQLSRHLGLLVPALMTFLDAKDILVLDAMAALASKNGRVEQVQRGRSNSILAKVTTLIASFVEHHHAVILWKFMLIFSIFFGTGLGAYTVVSFFQQRSKCGP